VFRQCKHWIRLKNIEGIVEQRISLSVEAIDKVLRENKESEFADKTGIINLTDVKIYEGNMKEKPFVINELLLFSDQIISCALIPEDYENHLHQA
jgi:hypothetical protein